ncbi:hypothetical protein ACI2OX_14655 [Bacillus sp. N9]
MDQGYKIKSITENLSGAFVEFERYTESQVENETLHVLTANGRKYFSVILLEQQRKTG